MPRKTMYEYLKCGAEKLSNKTALVYYGRKFTYEELMEKIAKFKEILATPQMVLDIIKEEMLEIKNKYDQMLLTSAGSTSIVSSAIRTTETLDRLKYENANDALNQLTAKADIWPEIINQVAFIRKYIK